MQKWQKLGLIWGIWMYVMMTLIWPYVDGEKMTFRKVLIGIPIWLISGLLFGYFQRNNFKNKEEN